MENRIYIVANDSGEVKQYFKCRDSAIAFIVDEFSMSLVFRIDNEGERLSEYMKTHNTTPNKYPFVYTIEEIPLNTEFDKPKKVYMVKSDIVEEGNQFGNEYLYDTYEEARETFDEIVDADIKNNGERDGNTSSIDPTYYERWNENGWYMAEHTKVELIEIEVKNGKYTKINQD